MCEKELAKYDCFSICVVSPLNLIARCFFSQAPDGVGSIDQSLCSQRVLAHCLHGHFFFFFFFCLRSGRNEARYQRERRKSHTSNLLSLTCSCCFSLKHLVGTIADRTRRPAAHDSSGKNGTASVYFSTLSFDVKTNPTPTTSNVRLVASRQAAAGVPENNVHVRLPDLTPLQLQARSVAYTSTGAATSVVLECSIVFDDLIL
jgi:hypothetical protein